MLYGWQVPTDFQFVCTGVSVAAVNTGAAVAITNTTLDWSIGLNASAVSLATVDGAGTWAPRRMPIGFQSWALGAAIGAVAETLRPPVETPLVTEGGRFISAIVQAFNGTATVGQIIRVDVFFNGYLE